MPSDFIWQYLDVADDIASDIQSRCKDALAKWEGNDWGFQPFDIGVTHFLGLELARTILIQCPPGERVVIHTDGNGHLDGKPNAVINIPIENCENIYTRFYKTDKKPKMVPLKSGILSTSYDLEDCIEIDKFILDRPIIWNASVLHSVDNTPNTKWRRSISLRFKENPWQLVRAE